MKLEKVPVLFLIFNRPENTKTVFKKIREYKPEKLYISADGPRLNNLSDLKLCKETRMIIDLIDWDCQIFTLFKEKNEGCKMSIIGGISWFFENEEYGIILEDDCLPSSIFFHYCSFYLQKMKNEKFIFSISGSRFNYQKKNQSVAFGSYSLMWGWATWSDRWKNYSLDVSDYSNILKKHFPRKKAIINYWSSIYELMKQNKIDTWDYQWILTVVRHSGMVIRPPFNLVKNLGFNENATHTFRINHPASKFDCIDKDFSFDLDLKHCSSIDKEDEKSWLNLSLIKLIIWRNRENLRKIGHFLRKFTK
jgi:hypothetical protein